MQLHKYNVASRDTQFCTPRLMWYTASGSSSSHSHHLRPDSIAISPRPITPAASRLRRLEHGAVERAVLVSGVVAGEGPPVVQVRSRLVVVEASKGRRRQSSSVIEVRRTRTTFEGRAER